MKNSKYKFFHDKHFPKNESERTSTQKNRNNVIYNEFSPTRNDMLVNESGVKMPKISKEKMSLETMKNISRGNKNNKLPKVA